jgi:hypothetical protein
MLKVFHHALNTLITGVYIEDGKFLFQRLIIHEIADLPSIQFPVNRSIKTAINLQ